MRIAAASRRRRACWTRDLRDGYAALSARCCLETTNAEDASLRPVRHRCADHPGAYGYLYVRGACRRGVKHQSDPNQYRGGGPATTDVTGLGITSKRAA